MQGVNQEEAESRGLEISRLEVLYQTLLGRSIDACARSEARARVREGTYREFGRALELLCSGEHLDQLMAKAVECHLSLIHRARSIMVRRLLPQARRILDLGGANAPLYTLGYAHAFEHMLMIDLPPSARHDMYKNVQVLTPDHVGGKVEIQYGDMTDLGMIPDGSFDLVWSGQSIEHVEREAACRMMREAFRVLAPGGFFCLDTPNRALTQIHTRDIGGGFIHPEHKHEYHAVELIHELEQAGFEVMQGKGVCEMHATIASGNFTYQDFVTGNPITAVPEDGYILYFSCRKAAGMLDPSGSTGLH